MCTGRHYTAQWQTALEDTIVMLGVCSAIPPSNGCRTDFTPFLSGVQPPLNEDTKGDRAWPWPALLAPALGGIAL